jgi:hypothetical protein
MNGGNRPKPNLTAGWSTPWPFVVAGAGPVLLFVALLNLRQLKAWFARQSAPVRFVIVCEIAIVALIILAMLIVLVGMLTCGFGGGPSNCL